MSDPVHEGSAGSRQRVNSYLLQTKKSAADRADTLLWPRYDSPADLAAIEAVPLDERGLPESTYAAVQRAGELWPDRTAMTFIKDAARWDQPAEMTFAALARRVTQVANLFTNLGASRTAPVGLLSPNTADLPAVLLGAQAAATAQPVNPGLAVDHIVGLLARSNAQVLVAAGPELDQTVWKSARIVAETLGLTALLALRPTGAAGPPPTLAPLPGIRVHYLADLLIEQPTDRLAVPPPGPDDVAAYFHTGGTTGAPKLAAHTHANEVIDSWMVAANSLLEPDATLFGALPLFHVNALIITTLAPLLRGQSALWAGPAGYRDPLLYGIFWKLVEKYRVAAMSAVPTVYAALAQTSVDADISSLVLAVVGAAALPESVRVAWEQRTGVTLCEGYGLTEGTCASARSFPDFPVPGSVGQRLPYTHIRTGEDGTLHVKGPNVFPGYLTAMDFRGPVLDGMGALDDGWLSTGDLARLGPDGFIHLTGRMKDVIIRGGHNIDPRVVEDALLSHPAVTAASTVGRPDRHAGEVPVAYVTVSAPVDEDALRAHAAARVPERAAAPRHVHIVDALPLTDIGKPYKLGLRLLATRQEVANALDLPLEDVAAKVEEGRTVVYLPPGNELSGYTFDVRTGQPTSE